MLAHLMLSLHNPVQQMYRKKFEFENARLVGWLVNPKIKDYFV